MKLLRINLVIENDHYLNSKKILRKIEKTLKGSIFSIIKGGRGR